MKISLISIVAGGALFAGSAMAADMPVKAPILKAPPMVYNWTGCYLDAGAGYGLWNQDHSTTFANGISNFETNSGGRGWLGRFGAGCDLQLSGTFSNFVIGLFGDYDAMDLTGTMATGGVTNRLGIPIIGDEKESSAWAVGGRVGYLLAPTILSYVDAGWAETHFGQIDVKDEVVGQLTGFAFPAHTYNGWFLGSGFEYQFNWLPISGLFLRSEYRFASYSGADLAQFNVNTGVLDGNVMHSKKDVQTVTTSLVWRFNWGGGRY